ncbi:hypothetical protein GCM10025862_14320 [Arsenicicoccus piscis]|uniref:Uncharacterized protein n=1 Tax=Arsenicicoccus piscis TaxID=673954 RepID=A0ABQ6HM16_9MICO|nr:hypothetical protein GCM10025862_14320 [Arsenicicoccus piscis]
MPHVAGLIASAEHVEPPPAPRTAATAEETDKILAWLETDGVRLVELDGRWVSPANGAGRARAELRNALAG